MNSLAGKVVVVTGASRGIGRALAVAYARRGARLVLLARDEGALAEVAAEVRALGARVEAVRCDVTSDADCAGAVEAARAAFGRIDVLVSNAGVALRSPVAKLELGALRDVLDVNLLGPLRLVQRVLPEMLARGAGQIVFVSSVVASRALPGLGGYAATKAALHAVADALRAEVEASGVDVIDVRPGKTSTDILASDRGTGAGRRPFERFQPSMTPEYVAERVVQACERRTPRLTLGVGAKLIALAERISPRLTDALAARTMGR